MTSLLNWLFRIENKAIATNAMHIYCVDNLSAVRISCLHRILYKRG